MKNKKGITLVALIITIIVMVILAGVIIASAVADGGIIDRAEEAMKKNERAEAEELVIASYVYKTTASMTTIGTLDLNATADAIYENLTSNGFTLMDGNVEAGSGSDILEGNKIELDIIGKHGNYGGTVTDKGLEEDLIIKDENNPSDNDTAGDTVGDKNTDEEIIWGEYEGYLYYIGNASSLTVESDKILVEEIIYTYSDYGSTYAIVEGTRQEKTFEDYTGIDFELSPNTKKIDFGNKLTSKSNEIWFGPNVEEISGLEGLTELDCYECNSLKYIEIPSTLKELDDTCFWNCYSLDNVVIPESVTIIKSGMFNCCKSLKNIIIPNTVTTIEYNAFRVCSSLNNVIIPNSVISIKIGAFEHCDSLTQITINKTKAEVEAEGGIGTAWIPDSVTRIIYLDQTVDLKYEFTFGDVLKMKDAKTSDMWWIISPENFWTDNVSEELKNSTINRKIAGENQDFITYNITCENENYINIFDADSVDGVANAYGIMVQDGNIMFGLTAPDGDQIESENYSEYEDLKFTISMSE